MFKEIANYIILAASVVTAITVLFRPVNFLTKKGKERKKKEQTELTGQISKKVREELTEKFDEIYDQNLLQQEEIDILQDASRDMLRKEILNIYNTHKKDRTLTETTRELLDDLYQDYAAEKGNSYVSKIYERMVKWEVVPDEE